MRTIETSFQYDEGHQRECKRNGVIKYSKHTINLEHIVSITKWVGTLLHEGRTGTQITDVNGKKYIDDRPYEEVISLLK
jgi:hypothetical protein